jgi:hypothetical protein
MRPFLGFTHEIYGIGHLHSVGSGVATNSRCRPTFAPMIRDLERKSPKGRILTPGSRAPTVSRGAGCAPPGGGGRLPTSRLMKSVVGFPWLLEAAAGQEGLCAGETSNRTIRKQLDESLRRSWRRIDNPDPRKQRVGAYGALNQFFGVDVSFGK